jgi:ABC-type sugar transport system substrate-binding protein
MTDEVYSVHQSLSTTTVGRRWGRRHPFGAFTLFEAFTCVGSGDEVIQAGKQVAIGKMMAVQGHYGLAHLQLATALAAAAAEGQAGGGGEVLLEVRVRGVGVTPVRPDWWPSDWGTEE